MGSIKRRLSWKRADFLSNVVDDGSSLSRERRSILDDHSCNHLRQQYAEKTYFSMSDTPIWDRRMELTSLERFLF